MTIILAPSLPRLATALFLCALIYPRGALAHGIEFSGGVHTNLSSEHRQTYGNASAFSIGYSARLSPPDVHLIFEVGYSANSGTSWPAIVYQSSESLAPGELDYWFVPVTLGIRANLVSERYQGPLGLYFGIGFLTVFTGIKDAYGSYSTPTLGGMIELRPQLQVAHGVSIWARERIALLADAQYGPATINYSGAALQLGLSLGAP